MLALITATRNSLATLHQTLESVRPFQERVTQVFVDGESTDGTVELLKDYVRRTPYANWMRQQGVGLYQALNQGILVAMSNPDVTHIGLLHSDDRLIPNVFVKYLMHIEKTGSPVFYSDIEFHNSAENRVRVWRSGRYSNFKLSTGWMPPHTSMIVAKKVYQDIGLYNPHFETAADYDWIVTVMSKYGADASYFPQTTLSMLVGGASSAGLKARLRANAMDGRVWAKKSKLQSLVVRVCKPLRKVGQFKLI